MPDPGGSSSELIPQIYSEFQKLAQHNMQGEQTPQTLSATALVHEAYLRISLSGICQKFRPF